MAFTLMAVHAHPDDESTSTGGILAHYAQLGVRIVLVTCTNGELGGPGRIGELQAACRILGVTDVELLGYHDSGVDEMPDGAFCTVPIATVAERVARLMDHYEPQVVVTYDHHNPHQHRDHVHAARVTEAAFDLSGVPAKLYFKAHGKAYWEQLVKAAKEVGIDREPPPVTDEVDRRITTTIDTRHVVERKRDALHAHASQLAASIAGRLPLEQFTTAFGIEHYIRERDTTGAPLPETDLFSGCGPDRRR